MNYLLQIMNPSPASHLFRTKAGALAVLASLLLSVAWVGGCASSEPSSQRSAGASKPNILLIYIDDMGWKDVGFMGSPYFHTPNIDRLAAQGMVFTNAYASAANCAPSRAALLSGQYAPRTGVYTVGSPARGKSRNRKLIPIENADTLARAVVTVGEALKGAGYATASMGKWHMGDPPTHGPEAQGFDLNVGGYRAGAPGGFGGYFSPWTNKYLEEAPGGTYLTDHITDKALAFVERNQEHPFFLYLPYYNVHAPWQAPDSLVQKYKKRTVGDEDAIRPTYGAMVEALDQNIGRLLQKLRETSQHENTIVLFTSDNGGHAAVTSMEPLRGSKGMFYEGGIRVPMAVRWPGVTEPGSTSDTPVIGIDFFPTLLEVAGASVPEDKILDGKSFLPLLRGEQDASERALFWHFPAYLQGYTKAHGHWRTTPVGAVRKGKWKLIEFFEDGRLELYNLEEDLGEQHNLAEERPEKTEEMHRMLERWRQSVDAPVPTEPNPGYQAEGR